MEVMPAIAICSFILLAFFSATEGALMSSNRLQLEREKRQNKLSAYIIKLFAKNPISMLAAVIVGSIFSLTLFCISISIYTYPFIEKITGNHFTLNILILCLILAFVIFILCDTIPKALSKIKPYSFLRFFSIPIAFFYIIFYPIAKPLSWLGIVGSKARKKRLGLGGKNPFEKHDLIKLVDEVDKQQKENEDHHQQEIELFRNALDFSEVRVGDCMTPRTEIEAVDVNDSDFDTLRRLFIESGFSRILIYENSIDSMIGYIHSKDLFEKSKTIQQMVRPVEFIPESMPAQKLLAKFIKEQKAIAVVVDEFGGTTGLVTIEDILEEIIGDIDDEHDSDKLTETQLSDTHFILSGRLEVYHLNRSYDLGIPESDEYETIAGYIIYKNEQLPKPKEVLLIDNFTIHILQMSSSKIDLIDLKVND